MVRKKKNTKGKHLLARQVSECVGNTYTISRSPAYSPNHISLYADFKGKATNYDLGSGEADDIIVELEIVVPSSEKKKGRSKTDNMHKVWVHALDLLEL